MIDTKVKYVYTFLIFSISMTVGIGLSSFGPSFVDLKYIMNTSMKSILLFSSFLSFGYLIGSLSGFLYKYLNRQIVSIVMIAINAISTILVPNSPYLSILYISAFLVGVFVNTWYNVKNVWLIEMWGKRSAPFILTCSFLFGVGTVIGPLIDGPYVTGEIDLENHLDINETLNTNGQIFDNITVNIPVDDYEPVDRRAKLMIPFFIIGSMQFIGALVMAIMYFISKYVKPNKIITTQTNECKPVDRKLFDSKECNEESEEKSNKKRKRILLIAMVSLFLAFNQSSEALYMQFSATYFQYIPLKLSSKKSAELVSSMAFTFTLGKGFSALVSMKLRPQKIICLHLSIVFIALSVLNWGQNSLSIVWTGAVIMSYGLSPIVVSTYCFLSEYLDVNNRIGAVLLFSSESLYIFMPLILGNFIEAYPQIFICVLFLNMLCSCSLFALILYIVKKAKSEASR